MTAFLLNWSLELGSVCYSSYNYTNNILFKEKNINMRKYEHVSMNISVWTCQYEHLGKSITTDKPLRYSDKYVTAIRKYCHCLDHLVSINKFSILGNAMNNYYVSLKESLNL